MRTDAVLVIGFGGPTRPDEIRPFLQNVVRGRNVPPERLEEVAHHYEEIGGCSPYKDLTFGQARALEARLTALGMPMPVYVGMRNWQPYLRETVAMMNRDGVHAAVGLIMAPHRSPTSWDRYLLDVQRAIEANGRGPQVDYLEAWHRHPLFLEAMAQRVEQASGYQRGMWPENVPLIFTTHSIPVSMAQGSRYVEETTESSTGIAEILGCRYWTMAYQSRSGDGRTPWLEPDISDVIQQAAARNAAAIVICPVGFLCDHVEVLFDLDVEARKTAEACGITLFRAGTVGDHPCFIELLAEQVVAAAARTDSG